MKNEIRLHSTIFKFWCIWKFCQFETVCFADFCKLESYIYAGTEKQWKR